MSSATTAPTSAMPTTRAKKSPARAGGVGAAAGHRRATLALAVLSLLTVTPFILMVLLALTPSDAVPIPDAFPTRLTFENILDVVQVSSFGRWFLNSVIFAGTSVVVVLLTSAMAGYALSKKRFPGSNIFLWSLIATFMVPGQLTLIPLFVMIAKMGGVNTLWGLILPTLASAQAVFLMRQFILDLPSDYFDAARIDGAGEWRTFVVIVLPLVRPVLATLGIFVFLSHWNDLLWPLVVGQTDEARTLTVGLATLSTETPTIQSLMAAAIVAAAPTLVVFALLQRFIVDSVASIGVKG